MYHLNNPSVVKDSELPDFETLILPLKFHRSTLHIFALQKLIPNMFRTIRTDLFVYQKNLSSSPLMRTPFHVLGADSF